MINKREIFLVATHVLFRNKEPVEGPYSSVISALIKKGYDLETIKVPLMGYDDRVIYGKNDHKSFMLSKLFGAFAPLKYILDIIVYLLLIIRFCVLNMNKEKIVIGIDPLSTFPAVILRYIFKYKLIFYSVDFNETRFENKILQQLYEFTDMLATKYSDQVWVVCDFLKRYKKKVYNVNSIYIPNSTVFDPVLSVKGKPLRKGNKLAWTGTLLTEKQYGILFGALEQIIKIRPDIEVYLVPIKDHDKFQKIIDKKGLKNVKIIHLTSRRSWQEFLCECDIGLAIYDPDFGSTKYIEPLKIWDFMMCGVPFIISSEPSISQPVKESGVAYLLEKNNTFPKDASLKNFLEKKNIELQYENCLNVAKEYAIDKRIYSALELL